mgnify:CR=1 FL=1
MYFKKILKGSFSEVTEKTISGFQAIGFGLITEIDMDKKLHEKLDVKVKPYKILGICNPGFAYKALQLEPDIGVFLPCKVIVKEINESESEVVAMDPSLVMNMLNNKELSLLATEVTNKIKSVVDNL